MQDSRIGCTLHPTNIQEATEGRVNWGVAEPDSFCKISLRLYNRSLNCSIFNDGRAVLETLDSLIDQEKLELFNFQVFLERVSPTFLNIQ